MGGVIDLKQIGGLRRRMPITYITFLVGSLALAGIPPFAGFWSKDDILAAVAEKAYSPGPAHQLYWVLYLVAAVTALLTAIYTFRAFFLTFHGEERIPAEAGHHAHESPPVMTGPLAILALGAIVVGGYFYWTKDFTGEEGFLAQNTPSLAFAQRAEARTTNIEPAGPTHLTIMVTSTMVAVVGVAAAMLLYLGRGGLLKALTAMMTAVGLYTLSYGKFFFDQIYQFLIVGPLAGIAWLSAWFDRNVIDGIVDAVGRLPRVLGSALRPLQGGMVQFYALAMVLGLLALIGALLM
jgi:NADH-quinone oxidoreductase subunit L